MNYEEIVVYLKSKVKITPEIGIILGSGLGMLAQEITEQTVVSYSEIPHFPQSTVVGHKGQFIFGYLAGKAVVCMDGRFHYYEGYDLQQVTLPVRVMKKIGISKLIVTNAAGGINADFMPGDLMLIRDHINLLGVNPLRGKNEETFGERFPDMSEAYANELRTLALTAADELKINLQQGIYVAMSGPSYETPAEIKYAKMIGADAVGMSTVPEVIVAVHCGLKVLGISCVTNMAAGISRQKLNHKEVMETAEIAKEKFMSLVKKVVSNM
ncbi:purine-nucleoside phosphorylase [Propionispira arboris]|uniref:Purine nucleoside phosphorylase n=1 Tax=Propionispira arboris TaxID=84035 RepID=A0A1H7BCY7_9FIRM|nr:purine-nucleoside phosphorylase [Propionispira arboris]SEJ75539.1 purine-nucleoside phosphorylase [Propionispira arboris]